MVNNNKYIIIFLDVLLVLTVLYHLLCSQVNNLVSLVITNHSRRLRRHKAVFLRMGHSMATRHLPDRTKAKACIHSQEAARRGKDIMGCRVPYLNKVPQASTAIQTTSQLASKVPIRRRLHRIKWVTICMASAARCQAGLGLRSALRWLVPTWCKAPQVMGKCRVR